MGGQTSKYFNQKRNQYVCQHTEHGEPMLVVLLCTIIMHMPAYMSPCVFVQRAQSRPVHVAIGVLLFIEQSYPCINSYVCKVLSLVFLRVRYVCSA